MASVITIAPELGDGLMKLIEGLFGLAAADAGVPTKPASTTDARAASADPLVNEIYISSPFRDPIGRPPRYLRAAPVGGILKRHRTPSSVPWKSQRTAWKTTKVSYLPLNPTICPRALMPRGELKLCPGSVPRSVISPFCHRKA